MKRIVITLLSTAALCAPLSAQEEDSPRESSDRRSTKKAKKDRGERPHFKRLTAEERVDMLKKRMKHNLEVAERVTNRFDADGNGVLSESELTDAAETVAKRMRGRGHWSEQLRGRTEKREEANEGAGEHKRKARRHRKHRDRSANNAGQE